MQKRFQHFSSSWPCCQFTNQLPSFWYWPKQKKLLRYFCKFLISLQPIGSSPGQSRYLFLCHHQWSAPAVRKFCRMFFLAHKYNPLIMHEILRDGSGIWGNILDDIQDWTKPEMVWFTGKRTGFLVRRLGSWYSPCHSPAGGTRESHLASLSLTIFLILKGTKNMSYLLTGCL